VPPSSDSLVAPQIQKLDDRSDVIFEVPKCSKMQIYPAGELTALPQTPYLTGSGSLLPSQEPHPSSRPSGPIVSTGLRV